MCKRPAVGFRSPTCVPVALGWALLLHAGPVLAQGQDSQTATMGSQTSPHPGPVGSEISVTSVPGGNPVDGLAPLPPELRRGGGGGGLALPTPVVLTAPARLHCDDIRDPTARARCAGRSSPPPPPAGIGEGAGEPPDSGQGGGGTTG